MDMVNNREISTKLLLGTCVVKLYRLETYKT